MINKKSAYFKKKTSLSTLTIVQNCAFEFNEKNNIRLRNIKAMKKEDFLMIKWKIVKMFANQNSEKCCLSEIMFNSYLKFQEMKNFFKIMNRNSKYIYSKNEENNLLFSSSFLLSEKEFKEWILMNELCSKNELISKLFWFFKIGSTVKSIKIKQILKN